MGKNKINSAKKIYLQWGLNPGPLDHHVNVLLTELSQQLVVSLNLQGIKSCSVDSRNDQSPRCEVVHETKFTLEIYCQKHTWLARSVEC